MSESLIVVQFSQLVLMGIILTAGINNLLTVLKCGNLHKALSVYESNRAVLASSLFGKSFYGVFTVSGLFIFIISCLTYVVQDPIMGGIALVSVFGGLLLSSLLIGAHSLTHH